MFSTAEQKSNTFHSKTEWCLTAISWLTTSKLWNNFDPLSLIRNILSSNFFLPWHCLRNLERWRRIIFPDFTSLISDFCDEDLSGNTANKAIGRLLKVWMRTLPYSSKAFLIWSQWQAFFSLCWKIIAKRNQRHLNFQWNVFLFLFVCEYLTRSTKNSQVATTLESPQQFSF